VNEFKLKMEDKYKNPRGVEDIMVQLKNCKTIAEVKNLINEIYPDLIQGFSRGYSLDYPELIRSWHNLCQALKTAPKGIILVEYVPPSIKDDNTGNYTLIRKFLDTMVVCGFVARRTIEFRICPTCKLVLPKHDLYKKIKFMKPESVPKNWDYKCSSCKPYEESFYEDGNPKLYNVPEEEREKYRPTAEDILKK
jgi:hypothetical protein